MVLPESLKQCELFSDLSDEELVKVVPICREEVYEPGAVIFGQDDEAREFHILQEGRVAIQMRLRSEVEPHVDLTIEESVPGRIFGWSALVKQRRFTASVQAVDRVRSIAIRGADLDRLFEEHAHIGFVAMKRLADVISSRLHLTRQHLQEDRQSEGEPSAT